MGISNAARQRRRKRIHSSDLACILNISPWANATDIYFEKAFKSEKEPPETDYQRLGNRFEGAILDEMKFRLGLPKIKKNPRTIIHADNINGSNIDATVPDNPRVHLEAKLVGLLHYSRELMDEWGEDGTDEIPDHVNIQVHHQMAVYGSEACYVGALLAGRGMRIYRIERNDELCNALLMTARDFWTEHVLKKIQPDGVPSLDHVRYLTRKERTSVQIKPAWVGEFYREASAVRLAAFKAEDRAKAALLAALGDCDEGLMPGGMFTYYANKRGARTLRWKEDQP